MRVRGTRPKDGAVLLVSGNRLGTLARKTVLEELGYRVTASPDATTALEDYTTMQFDVVIVEHKLPDKDGIQLIAELKQLEPGLRAILISGFGDTLGLDTTNTGAYAVIQKSANELVHLVRLVNRIAAGAPDSKGLRAAAHQRSPKALRRA